MSLLLGVSTADFAENQESSLTRLCQGLTAGGIAVLYPNTEQSPPSPSDQPEMPSSKHNHIKGYSAGQEKEPLRIKTGASVKWKGLSYHESPGSIDPQCRTITLGQTA